MLPLFRSFYRCRIRQYCRITWYVASWRCTCRVWIMVVDFSLRLAYSIFQYYVPKEYQMTMWQTRLIPWTLSVSSIFWRLWFRIWIRSSGLVSFAISFILMITSTSRYTTIWSMRSLVHTKRKVDAARYTLDSNLMIGVGSSYIVGAMARRISTTRIAFRFYVLIYDCAVHKNNQCSRVICEDNVRESAH